MSKHFPYRATHILLAAIFSLLFSRASAQQFEFTREIHFIQYLQDKESYDEAKAVLQKIDKAGLSREQLDTIYYLSGWGAYLSKQLDSAVFYLLKVTPSFPLFTKSRFFAGYCLAFTGSINASAKTVTGLVVTDSVNKEMQSFQLAGLALLQRNYATYRKLQPAFSFSYYAMQQEEQRFKGYYAKLSGYKSKSPLLAGIYSALLPGAGKYYAGKKRQGIAAFLPILSLGLVTYEAYRKGGAGSARFIAFGSLFSVFYIGNIWGSVLSVKIKQKEFYREYDNKILFDLHIPLRNLYN